MMLEDMIEYRRALHRIPELENHLPKTCAFVKAQLQGLGCTVTEPIEGAVCAFFDEGKEDTLAFRADMDALPITEQTGLPFSSEHPGKMHACGHDGHTAMLLGLAKTVAARHGTLRHNVLLVFQPAEENPGGARPLCRSGIFARCHVRAIFGFHLWPGLPLGEIATRPGALMAKSSEITLHVHGKSVHISKYQEGADSLLAASTFLQRVYAMEREVFPPETPRLLKFGRMEAGRIRNAIAARRLPSSTASAAMPLPPTQCWKAVCGRLRWRTLLPCAAAVRRLPLRWGGKATAPWSWRSAKGILP